MSDRPDQPTTAPPEATAKALAARDRFPLGLGIELLQCDGHCITLQLRVTDAHVNFTGFCHGGVIFSLADTACGLLSNSRGPVAVLLDAHMTYTTAARVGDLLTVTGTELNRTRRTCVMRAEVHNEQGALVAHFTGTTYVLAQPRQDGSS